MRAAIRQPLLQALLQAFLGRSNCGAPRAASASGRPSRARATHAFDGSYGGLWRRPRPSAAGVGRSRLQHAGRIQRFPLHISRRHPRSRVAFMREGIEDKATLGGVLGERGLMGGGAAGHELDRADVRLGTPPHAIIIGQAVVEDPTYQPVNEERRDHTWPAARGHHPLRPDILRDTKQRRGVLGRFDELHRRIADRRSRQRRRAIDHQHRQTFCEPGAVDRSERETAVIRWLRPAPHSRPCNGFKPITQSADKTAIAAM